jgi:hypothetical protein
MIDKFLLSKNKFSRNYPVLQSGRQLTIEPTPGKESGAGSTSRVSAEDAPSAGRFLDGLAQ